MTNNSKRFTKDTFGNTIPICEVCGHGVTAWIEYPKSHSNGYGTIIVHEIQKGDSVE